MQIEPKVNGWTSMKNKLLDVIRVANKVSNSRIQRGGTTDSITFAGDSLVINLQDFPDVKTSEATTASGGSTSSHPYKMTFSLNVTSDPVVTLNTDATEVYLRGTNDFIYTGGDATGRAQNIASEIALTSAATNYVYLESGWDDSTSTEPDDFDIVVYTSEQDLTEIDTDTTPTPDVEYQSKARTLIGTLTVNASDELTASTQFTNTRLFAELFDVSSSTVYLIVP